jgi:hypothetical protein
MISFLVSVTSAVQLAKFSDVWKERCLEGSACYDCILSGTPPAYEPLEEAYLPTEAEVEAYLPHEEMTLIEMFPMSAMSQMQNQS